MAAICCRLWWQFLWKIYLCKYLYYFVLVSVRGTGRNLCKRNACKEYTTKIKDKANLSIFGNEAYWWISRYLFLILLPSPLSTDTRLFFGVGRGIVDKETGFKTNGIYRKVTTPRKTVDKGVPAERHMDGTAKVGCSFYVDCIFFEHKDCWEAHPRPPLGLKNT